MKLLLINPAIPDYSISDTRYAPLSLLYLGSYVNACGHDVKIVEMNKIDTNELLNIIKTYKPNLVGINCLFSGQFPIVYNLCKDIKKEINIPVIVGGIHPTIYYKEISENCPEIDYICVGEGENVLKNLLDKKLNVKEKCLFGVPLIKDLNALPILNYDLINFSDYYHDNYKELPNIWHNPRNLQFKTSVPILTSRGCPMACNFCSMYLVMGRGMRFRDYNLIADEIELLYKKYGHTHFSFMDDNLTANKKHVVNLCNEIIKRDLTIQFETPNGVSTKFLDKEVLDALVKAGLIRVSLAIESGSEYIRNKVMKKHLLQEQIYDIIGLTKQYKNLQVRTFFIMGMPEDTNETFQETYDMIEKTKVDKPIVTNLVPFPGTKVFNQCVNDNLFIDDIDVKNLWKFDKFYYAGNKRFFIKPYNMTLEELNNFRLRFDELISKQIIENKRDER